MAERRDIGERYRITRKLGESAFTSVHAATDATNGAMVVVKRIAPGRNPEAMSRFLQTATALAKIRHPTIPSLLDFGTLPDGGAFMLLEPVAGRGLEVLAGAAPAEVLSHLLQVLDGLELLGQSGIAHGNLVAENIRLAGTSTGEQAKLLGFGTRILHPPIAGMPGVEGTAPEMLADGAGDSRSDVYSFARIACRLLDIGIQNDSRGEPELSLPLGVSFELEDAEALRQALLRSLRRSPADRPSWNEVREGLRTALRGPVAQPSVGEKTNPVYIPPSATDGDPPALRFEESFEGSTPAPSALLEALPPLAFADPLPPSAPPTPPTPSIPPTATTPPIPAPIPATPIPPSPKPPAPVSASDDLLSSVEDFLAAPIVAPITAPAAQREVAPAFAMPIKPPDTAEIPVVPQPRRSPGKSKKVILIALAAAIGLGVLAAILIYLRDRDVDPFEIQDELRVPATPAATPSAPIDFQSTLGDVAPAGNPGLAAARAALDAGNPSAALAALNALDASSLSPEEREEAKALRDSLGQSQIERLAADLKRGLRTGNVTTLRSTVRAITANRTAFFKDNPSLRTDFDRAKEIVRLSAQLQQAAKGSDPLATVRLAGSFAELAPRDKTAPRLREQAAATIEAEADRLSQSGQAQVALNRLEALRAAWPERPGVRERIGRIRTVAEVDPRLDRVLANAQAAAQRKRPDEGLAILRAANPTGPYVERFRELSDRLKADFAQLDQNPPAIELREGSASEFEKGATTRVSLRITDDFQVAKTALFARPEGGSWQTLELRQSGSFYTTEIPASFHQNKNLQWYATATDVSGHTAQLGSESAPRVLKRKKWFDRIRGSKEEDGGR